MLSVTNKPLMLNDILLSVVMLTVLAPLEELTRLTLGVV
jgi:hypothetical protein